MKKIIYIISALIALSAVSCTDLTSERFDKINPDIFPQSESDAEALIVAAAYGPFRPEYAHNQGLFTAAYGGIQTATEMSTDIGYCQWGDSYWPDVLNFNFTPNSLVMNQFYQLRASVSAMTVTFNKIADIPMKQEVKDRMNAELHCGRGWLNFYLYSLYGPIPIVPAETINDVMSDIVVPRSSKEEMVKHIKDDLEAAINVLPARYEPSNSMYGRFTRGLAYTILMKLYMHEGDWANAEKVGRELMKPEYGYALVPEYKDIFTIENERNSEIIWAVICENGIRSQMWLAHVLPSQYPTQVAGLQKWNGFRVPWNFYNTFDKQDGRLEVLVGEFTDKTGYVHKQPEDPKNPDSKNTLINGALPVKYGEDPEAPAYSSIDWVVYRYADVVTLLSEAIVRNKKAVTQEAVDLMNMVRERAGINPYKLSDIKGVDDFLEIILLERGHELWFEGHRKDDLIRHGKYIEYARKYKGSTTAKDHFVLWPLPQSAIDEGKGVVVQNPGY